ncbi:hypothetical protein VE03_10355 [Pseudogymnoascus sp. 23342-1-I1]|nr:hypothetical protein VE03_10355 [Pseudogymnoascus sp. 23342-1-I1]
MEQTFAEAPKSPKFLLDKLHKALQVALGALGLSRHQDVSGRGGDTLDFSETGVMLLARDPETQHQAERYTNPEAKAGNPRPETSFDVTEATWAALDLWLGP